MRAVASLAVVVLGCATASALPPPAPVVAAAALDAGTVVAKKEAAPAPLPLPAEIAGPALRRLDFKGGDPVVPVRLMEGQTQVTFGSAGRLRLSLFGKIPKTVEGPAGSTFTVPTVHTMPASGVEWASAISRQAIAVSAAARKASRRMRMGVEPECAACPTKRST